MNIDPKTIRQIPTMRPVDDLAEYIAPEVIGKSNEQSILTFMMAHIDSDEFKAAQKERHRLYFVANLVKYFLLGIDPDKIAKWHTRKHVVDPDVAVARAIANRMLK